MKRLLVGVLVGSLVGVPSAQAASREQRATGDARAFARILPGFDTYAVRCGPRFCRWYLDDLDRGRTCTARTYGIVRCSRFAVPSPDPYP